MIKVCDTFYPKQTKQGGDAPRRSWELPDDKPSAAPCACAPRGLNEKGARERKVRPIVRGKQENWSSMGSGLMELAREVCNDPLVRKFGLCFGLL